MIVAFPDQELIWRVSKDSSKNSFSCEKDDQESEKKENLVTWPLFSFLFFLDQERHELRWFAEPMSISSWNGKENEIENQTHQLGQVHLDQE